MKAGISLSSNKLDIFSLSLAELQEVFSFLKLPSFRAKQVHHWLYNKHVWSFSKMTNIAKKEENLLENNFIILPDELTLLNELVSGDRLTKK